MEELDVAGKRVLVRVDFNVPLSGGVVADDTRIRAAIPTIQGLCDRGARVVLMSHLGRPGGRSLPDLSLSPVATALQELLGKEVKFCPSTIGEEAEKLAEELADGQVLLLENLRFDARETANDDEFAEALARLGDVFVNDAFGTAHRAHASNVGVARHLPSAAGLLMVRELEVLGDVVSGAERPLTAVVGGAKVSGKLEVLRNLVGKVDTLLIGGAMAFTFSLAQGGRVGASLVEESLVNEARGVLEEAASTATRVILPRDVVTTQQLKGDGPTRVVPFGEVPDGWKGVDIGPQTAQAFSEHVVKSRTVLFNGPLGVFEVEAFRGGTCAVLEAMAGSDAHTVLGGGDTAAAAAACHVTQAMGHISTGGGASLEFLEGKTLPAVAALTKSARRVRA